MKFHLTILSFFFSVTGFCQTENVDSLINESSQLHYSNVEKARELAEKALVIVRQHNLPEKEASVLDQLSKIERELGNYEGAIQLLFKALEIDKSQHNLKGQSVRLLNLGVVYYYMEDLPKTAYYFKQSLKIDQSLGDSSNLMVNYNNLGAVYEATAKYDSALIFYKEAEKVIKALNDTTELAATYTNIGNLYFSRGADSTFFYNKAINYYQQAVDIIADNSTLLQEKVATLQMLSLSHSNLGNNEIALQYIEQAKRIAEENNNLRWKRDVYNNLAQVLSRSDIHDSAYYYIRLHYNIKDSLFNAEKSKQIAEMETKYQTAEKEKQLKIQQLELDKNQAELAQHELFEYALSGGILLLLALGGQTIIRSREKSRSNELLTIQKQEIERKNYEILDSIQYAKRIQHAILPPEKLIKDHLKDSCILYLPKDIVSGDFYWMHYESESLLFATVDCTGHGVPGAFMSIVGYNMLNKMVNELNLHQPAEILTNLNKYVADSLHQHENTDIKDGMDISICSLDREHKTLQFAGANNPLYIIRNGKLLETKGDKMAIGSYYFRDDKFFTNHEIQLEEGDSVYIFTDGFADQFGGVKEKKFMYSHFKQLLIDIEPYPIEDRKQKLLQEFNRWKGNLEQVDDICIVGVQI